MEIVELWPEVEGDLTQVTWSHGTNSIAALTTALNDDTMMIEADVSLGFVLGQEDRIVPIMAHPPAFISDLSLEDFMDRVIQARNQGFKKGVKLDFKSTEVLQEAFRTLPSYENEINFPFWLNGDVSNGPKEVEPLKIVSGSELIQLAAEFFPKATLSLGWVTSSHPADGNYFYTEEQIQELLDVMNTSGIGNQTVTFPIRTLFMANSEAVLTSLLAQSKAQSATLTMWGTDDIDDTEAVKSVLNRIGRQRVYMDLPDDLADQLS
ncbi:hypothetical protein TCAL_10447 [Tigriopus californicus]|uniref:Menorin-like domain-containing protein n=2 Tax=Tigriopus californicus TaxID=6832 RepID=A0A553PU79_TIGCA|nr:hypothetical protein TCAL_10447 [Tigriopus californicus]